MRIRLGSESCDAEAHKVLFFAWKVWRAKSGSTWAHAPEGPWLSPTAIAFPSPRPTTVKFINSISRSTKRDPSMGCRSVFVAGPVVWECGLTPADTVPLTVRIIRPTQLAIEFESAHQPRSLCAISEGEHNPRHFGGSDSGNMGKPEFVFGKAAGLRQKSQKRYVHSYPVWCRWLLSSC